MSTTTATSTKVNTGLNTFTPVHPKPKTGSRIKELSRRPASAPMTMLQHERIAALVKGSKLTHTDDVYPATARRAASAPAVMIQHPRLDAVRKSDEIYANWG